MNDNMKTVADINWRCRCGDWKIETWTKFKYYRPDHIVEDVQFEPALCSKCGEEMDLSTVKVQFLDWEEKPIQGTWMWPNYETTS